jgi:hypothetical protein
MTRQTWRLIIGACLCFGPLPGCTHSVFSLFTRDKAVEPPKKVKVDNPVGATGQDPRDGRLNSDYNQSNGNPLVIKMLYPNRTEGVSVLPLPNPEAQIPVYAREGGEESELPPLLRQPPKADQPAPAQQAVKPEPQEPLVIALARLLEEDTTALALLDYYEPSTRDWFLGILPLLASLNKTPLSQLSSEEAAGMQDQLQGLLLALRARTDLTLNNMCYLESEPDPVRRSYRIRRLPEEHPFLPRSGDRPGERVCVYVELRNLGTVRSPNGQFYETRLSSSVTISEDPDGKVPKYYRKFNAPPLRSPDLSSDFYNTYSFYMPADIPPGRYYLTLEVWDETTQPARYARSRPPLPFVVAAQAVAGN